MSLADAIAAAAAAANLADGTELRIARGEAEIRCVSATRGSSTFETLDANGAVVLIRSQDFLILADDYDFGDGPVEPARGDLVTLAQADGDHVYELLDLASAPAWRWSDPFQVRLRIHTKEISKPE